MSGDRYAFATLVTSDGYLPGALAVAAALKEVHPKPPTDPKVSFKTVCIVTPETVDVNTIRHLRKAFDIVFGVEVIQEETSAELEKLGRPDLETVLTKLHVFRLTQFEKVIFLDADVLPVRPLSHLFALPHEFSAVPDVGWPDIFNSGMMVLTPRAGTFDEIMAVMRSSGSWDGGDQGVLNEWRGDNWHRLSFTYNTTPTAIYTFRPAYDRFGSSIRAVHFIGPKKPWHDLPFRAPSAASQLQVSARTQSQTVVSEVVGSQAVETLSGSVATTNPQSTSATGPLKSFAFSDLVDRWFEVYDRNYRQLPQASEEDYLAKRYDNAWDESSIPSQEVDRLEFTHTSEEGPIALEDLRRLAVEGSGGQNVSRGSEGQYRSLPLEGRIDLMRPKKEPAYVSTSQETTPTIRIIDLSSGAPVEIQKNKTQFVDPRWTEVGSSGVPHSSSPGPNEVPPSPYLLAKSLPPSGPSSRRSSPGQNALDLTTSEKGLGSPRSSAYVLQPRAGDEAHERDIARQHKFWTPSSQENTANLDLLDDQGYQHVSQHHQQPSADPPRPVSPPLVSWNPATEPPPNIPPNFSSFPVDTFYPNAWDIPTGFASRKLHADLTGSTLSSTSLFEAPPPSKIPARLVQEGHYRNILGNQSEPAQQPWRPDVSKVASVFPWEQKPRHVPGRVFPAGEVAPSAVYIEEMQQASETEFDPEPESTPETKVEAPEAEAKPAGKTSSLMKSSKLSPPVGYPGTRGYGNAWDAVPSIQKYAARLVKPTVTTAPMVLQSPRTRRRSTSYMGHGEQSDANSMDGDVEDEVDDDSDGGSVKFSSDERSGGSRKGSKAGSPAGSVRGDSGKKKYRSYGVQTVPKDVRSVAVQVSQPLSDSTGPSNSKKTYGAGPPPAALSLATRPMQELELKPEPTALATPSVLQTSDPFSGRTQASSHLMLPSGALSPRLHDAYSYRATTPVGMKAQDHGKAETSQGRGAPAAFMRTSSNETADSPLGPASPVDLPDAPSPPARKGPGRQWNPSTGIDVFKRNSEEVLARFLRLGSWEDEAHGHA